MRSIWMGLMIAGALVSSGPGFHNIVAKPAIGATSAVARPTAPNTTGTIMGTIKLDGSAPQGKPTNMAKEPECVKLHAVPVLSEEVVVGEYGALQNVIVFISEGLSNPPSDPPAEPAVIDQKGCTYRPHVVALRANQKLRIVNSDPTSHNIHPLPRNNREWNRSQPPGLPPFEESFAREEIAIPVKCNVHPWMRSYIAVFKHPYFAVTGPGGTFDLRNLPPGNYTIAAWHEKYGTLTQTISIAANETKPVKFIFKSRPGAK